jgi:hypothetical protein
MSAARPRLARIPAGRAIRSLSSEIARPMRFLPRSIPSTDTGA